MSRYFELRRKEKNRLLGREIFDIKPVILGGDPEDISNKAFLTREQHIQAVRYWNKLINKIRHESGEGSSS